MTPRLELSGLRMNDSGGGPEGVSLQVRSGEIVALLGANGAGKTTLMRAIMGFAAPMAGEIRLDGRPIVRLPAHARSRLGLGYCPEGRQVFPQMTVCENLEVAARRPGLAAAARLAGIHALFPVLAERQAMLAGQLSGGEQQMLAIGRALMTEPSLLLLDEPSLGLSPRFTGQVFARLREIAAGGVAILLAEQNAAKALAVADRAYLLRLGRVVRSGDAAELRARGDIEQVFLGG